MCLFQTSFGNQRDNACIGHVYACVVRICIKYMCVRGVAMVFCRRKCNTRFLGCEHISKHDAIAGTKFTQNLTSTEVEDATLELHLGGHRLECRPRHLLH
jgi:hypothetical protein